MSTASCRSLRGLSIPRNHDGAALLAGAALLDGVALLDGAALPDGVALLDGIYFADVPAFPDKHLVPVKDCDPVKQRLPVMIARISRDTALVCGFLALVAALWFRTLSASLGVIGGGLLIGLSFWAIRGSIEAFVGLRSGGETPRGSGRLHLVKFFTRHGMLALAAYGMMVRLQLDPVAMLVGVTSLGVAVAVEAVRSLRWRRCP